MEWLKTRWKADYDVKHWFVQLFLAVDQLLNIFCTPFSKSAWADETLSSRAYRAWKDKKHFGFAMYVIDWLFFWQKIPEGFVGHCHHAYDNERNKTGLPPEMR